MLSNICLAARMISLVQVALPAPLGSYGVGPHLAAVPPLPGFRFGQV